MQAVGSANAHRCPICRGVFAVIPPPNVELTAVVDRYIANLRGTERSDEIRRRLGVALTHARHDRVKQLLKLDSSLQVCSVKVISSDGRPVSLLENCLSGFRAPGNGARARRLADMVRALLRAGLRPTAEDIYTACVLFQQIHPDPEVATACEGAVLSVIDACQVAPTNVGPGGHTALFYALEHANAAICTKLIHAGAPLNVDKYESLLAVAVWAATRRPQSNPRPLDAGVVKAIVAKGAKLLQTERSLNARLPLAIQQSDGAHVIAGLLSVGADANARDGGLLDRDGKPLSVLEAVLGHAASQFEDDSDDVRRVRSEAALEIAKALPARAFKHGHLHYAARQLQDGAGASAWRGVMRVLLDKGITVNDPPATPMLHSTLLGLAILAKDSQAIALLLEHGASVKKVISGRSYLGLAMETGQHDLSRTLVAKGAVLGSAEKSLNKRLGDYVQTGWASGVQQMLELGASVTAQNSCIAVYGGGTKRPLHYATSTSTGSAVASINMANTAGVLLGHGAAASPVELYHVCERMADKFADVPAVVDAWSTVAGQMLNAGVRPDHVDKPSGMTALGWALKGRAVSVAYRLIVAGAAVNCTRGTPTFMGLAFQTLNVSLLQEMVDRGAVVHAGEAALDDALVSALTTAAPSGAGVLDLLIQSDVNVRSSKAGLTVQGQALTPVAYAVYRPDLTGMESLAMARMALRLLRRLSVADLAPVDIYNSCAHLAAREQRLRAGQPGLSWWSCSLTVAVSRLLLALMGPPHWTGRLTTVPRNCAGHSCGTAAPPSGRRSRTAVHPSESTAT